MKRVLMLMMAMMLFAGCKKESSNMLVGTTWETDDNFIMSAVFGYKYHVYEFYSEDMVSAYYTNSVGKIMSVDGDYKYELNYPNLTIYTKYGEQDFEFGSRNSFTSKAADPYTYFKR